MHEIGEQTDWARHPENLLFAYHRELIYWTNCWREQAPAVLRRLDDALRCDCPQFAIDMVERLRAEGCTKPKVLDFGCGPFSNLCHLQRSGLADVTGVDALAEEYGQLYREFGIEPPVPLVAASGETLLDGRVQGPFDFVFVQNALDHTAAPALSWLNLYELTREGGFLGHCHGVDEATHEQQDQLHQFNLRPDDSATLLLDDLHGYERSLVGGLDLSLEYACQIPISDDYDYFVQIWRKTGSGVSAELLRTVNENLRRAFVRRSRWAFTLEDRLLNQRELAADEPSFQLAANKP